MSSVRSRKMFVVDGPKCVLPHDIAGMLPGDYCAFVSRFGNTQLYRHSSYYKVGVFCPPLKVVTEQGDSLLQFGRFDHVGAYFKLDKATGELQAHVYEFQNKHLKRVDDSFSDWLLRRAKAARKTFKREEWKQVVEGATPFTQDELAIVSARRQFQVELVDFDIGNRWRFKIHNASNRYLKFLSIGILHRNQKLEGGLWIPVAHISPGSTEIVAVEGYDGFASPDDVQLKRLPDPDPEERDIYWEFK